MGGSSDIASNSRRLRALIDSKPNREAEAFVLAQLGARKSGPESLAARVFSSWGRAVDRDHIKTWFTERMLERKISFRPDLIEVFSCFREADDLAYLAMAFKSNRSARSTLGSALRDIPGGGAVARQLIEQGDLQLAVDVINHVLWRRSRDTPTLKKLKGHASKPVADAARRNLLLFDRYPSLYD